MAKLDPSIKDHVFLAQAVEERFLGLTKAYLRIKGIPLDIPPELYDDFIRFREMRVRHKQGDYRNTEDEIKSLHDIATWTVAVNAAMRGQKMPHIEWRENAGLPNA